MSTTTSTPTPTCYACETTVTRTEANEGLCPECRAREDDWQSFTAAAERSARTSDPKLLWNTADQLADMAPAWWAALPCLAFNALHAVLLSSGFILDASAAVRAHLATEHTHEATS